MIGSHRESFWTPASGTAGVVIDTWRYLRAHADSCEECAEPVAELRRVPDQPALAFDRLCEEGQRLYAAWDAGKRELAADPGPADIALASIRRIRALFEFEGLDQVAAELRNRALERVPPEAFQRLKELPHEERMAQVRALETAIEPHDVRAPYEMSAAEPLEGTGIEERLCEGPECSVRFVPSFARQRYHTEACKQRAYRQRPRQASLIDTEVDDG